jgi:hypothetical protein
MKTGMMLSLAALTSKFLISECDTFLKQARTSAYKRREHSREMDTDVRYGSVHSIN